MIEPMFGGLTGQFEGWSHEAIAGHAAAVRAEREQVERDQLAVVAAWWAAGGPEAVSVGVVRATGALLGIADRDARALVRVLRWCHRFPTTAAAVLEGTVPVAVAAPFARVVTRARRDLYAAHEAAVLADLATLRVDEAERYAAAWASAADDALSDPLDAEAEHASRGLWASAVDGVGHLRGRLTPDALAELLSVLDAMVPPDALDIPGGPRTLAQRRHDALADLARLAADGAEPGTGSSVTVNAVVDLERLLHHDDGCPCGDGSAGDVSAGDASAAAGPWVAGADGVERRPGGAAVSRSEIDHAGPVAARLLRRYACDAWLTRTVVDAHGAVIDHSDRVRFFTPAQRRAMRVRQPTCGWPLCDRPTTWCDAHHLSGRETTDLEHGVLLCRHHHTRVHAGWTIARGADGVFTVQPPRRT